MNKFKIILVDNDFPAFDKPFVRKTTVTELSSIPPKIPVISDTSPTNIPSQQTQRKFFKSPMTLCLYGLFLVQIVALSICLWFFLHKKPIHRGRSSIITANINTVPHISNNIKIMENLYEF